MNIDPSVRPNIRELMTAAALRLYPFNSGCGRLSNSRLVAMTAGKRRANIWANVFGARALVPIHDHVGRAMYFTGDLDPKVSWAVQKFTRPGDVALDIGANLGLVSLQMARIVGHKGRVHAFEPNPRMICYLNETLKANPDLPLIVHSIALARASGELPLAIPERNSGAASLHGLNGRRVQETVTVQTRSLEEFCEAHGIDRIDFIKIDVEGFETEVLAGAMECLRRMRPRAILFEENRFTEANTMPTSFSLLQAAGYEIRAIPRNLLRNRLVPLTDLKAQHAHDFVAFVA